MLEAIHTRVRCGTHAGLPWETCVSRGKHACLPVGNIRIVFTLHVSCTANDIHVYVGWFVKVLQPWSIADVPQSVGVPSILPSSLTRGIFSLSWTELTSVFGGVGSYEVLVRADKQGDTTRLCGEMTAPNRNTVPLRQFTGWIAEGQVCYFSVVTVTGDICSFRSSPSQEASITLQGTN